MAAGWKSIIGPFWKRVAAGPAVSVPPNALDFKAPTEPQSNFSAGGEAQSSFSAGGNATSNFEVN